MSEHQEEEFKDEFIEADQIDEVVPDDAEGAEPMSDDEGEGEDQGPNMDDPDKIVIDLSNNSSGYFEGHEDSVFMVRSHPTLPMVVTGGGDNKGYLWTTHKPGEGTKVATLTGHTESVTAGGFTANGNYLVTGDMTGQIRVWKSRRKGEMWEFIDSNKEVEEVVWIVFHPTQDVFAVGASDGSVWVYELEPNLNNVAVLSSHASATTAGAFVETENLDKLSLVTVSEDSTIIRWDCYGAQTEWTLGKSQLHGDHPWISLSVSPTEKTFAAGSVDGTLVIVNTESGAVLKIIDTGSRLDDEQDRCIEAIAWGPGAKVLAVGNVAAEIQLYDLGSWQLRRTLKVGDAVTKLEFIKDTPFVISASHEGAVYKWDARNGAELFKGVGHNMAVLDFALQENGRRIITAGDEGVSLVFDAESSSQALTTA